MIEDGQDTAPSFKAADEMRSFEAKSGPTDAVKILQVSPSLANAEFAAKIFDAYVDEDTRALVLDAYATGALPDSLTPLIERAIKQNTQVFVVAGNSGEDHGVNRLKYETHVRPAEAGAVFLRDVNTGQLEEIIAAIKGFTDQGLSGPSLVEAVVERFGVATQE